MIMHSRRILLLIALVKLTSALVSNRLDVGISDNVAEEQPLDLRCTITASNSELESCTWHTPDSRVYFVQGDSVTDQSGNEVPGVSVDNSDPKICHITIQQLRQEQIGTWSCQLSFSGVNEYQVAFLNAITAPRVSDVRLPTSIVSAAYPESYEVTLIPHIVPDDWEIEGDVKINLNITGSGDKIYLHAKEIVIYEDTVVWKDLDSGLNLTIAGFGYDKDRDFFIIYLASSFSSTRIHQLSFKFSGILNDDLSGFYRTFYNDPTNGEKHFLAITQFQATDARKAFPCMDEPNIKSKYSVKLGRPSNYTSASNMPLKTSEIIPNKPGYVLDIFEQTPKMSTYLLAFLISDFSYREGVVTPNNVPFRIWSQPALYELTEYAADIGPRILQYYEDYFNVTFPLPKQDMAAIPEMSFGGMENWGLITYREGVLLYEEGVSSLQAKDRITDVVAHELAHQWFGDLVTMEWWSDLWLNEGFATYVALSGGDLVQPDFGQSQRAILSMNQVAYALDALDSSHPVQVTVNHPDEINEIFDDISYEKGAALIRMMVNFLEEKTFKEGVTNYLKHHQYGNTITADLFDELTQAALEAGVLPEEVTVNTIMESWTMLKGFPMVTVSRPDPFNRPKEVLINQNRFLLSESDPNDTAVYRWWIPLSIAYVGEDFSTTVPWEWISPVSENVSLTLPDDPFDREAFILNVQGTGFYRVNYDLANWQAIAATLEFKHEQIHVLSRSQLINDALSIARQGSLSYNIALDQTKYLFLENEYVPWATFQSDMSYIQLMMQRTADFQELKTYLTNQVVHIYNNIGYEAQPSDKFFDILLRELSLDYLCGFEYPECVDKATAEFDIWSNSPNPDDESSNPIDVGIRRIVYCTAISTGDSSTWDFLQMRFIKSGNANEKSTILSALGCSKDVPTLQRFLDMTLDPNSMLRVTDGRTVVQAVSSNPLGTSLAWDWMQREWNAILDYYDTAVSSPVARMVSAVTKSFNTQQELEELQSFYNTNEGNLGTAERATKAAIDTVKGNVQWMENHFETVVSWLQDQNDGGKENVAP